MQLSGFLDVAVTIVVTFVLASLLCTTINELVVTLLKTRANTLHRTVSALLDDQNIRSAFFNHGLIKSLGIGSTGGKEGDTPPSSEFDKTSRSSYIDGRTFADALLGTIEPGKPIPAIDDVQKRVDLLEDGQLKAALALAVASANESITSVRDEMARWFDTSMDRLSGHYTRYMKWLSLGVGLAVAIALNIDTIDIAASSWKDPQVRQAAIAVAETLDPSNAVPACTDEATRINCLTNSVATTTTELSRLPVGWEGYQIDWANPGWWIVKLAGWIITALAASVGAPFWFDILQNVMSLRGAGVKRDDKLAGTPVK
jgi:hypothetical protein